MTTSAELDALRAQFEGVAQTIGAQLSAVSPRVTALVAKWSKEDLVPGLSDMDFRIVCDEATTADDWVAIDRHVGQIHRQMVAEHPEWNRINEHTAGAGVNLNELDNARFHHPEYAVWTVWWGSGDWSSDLQVRTLARPLCGIDEHYHLSRFLAYYSPYIHGIDPPINLGAFEPKYALHSRCWHYFAPPILSAATLLARRHFPSKRAGLLWLIENRIVAPQTRAVLQQVDAHYETPEKDTPQLLARFEQFLFTAFEELIEPVCDSIEFLELPSSASRPELQAHLDAHLSDPVVELLEHVRFTRIRAGRYYFYLNAPHHFSAKRQLLAEQSWTRKLFGSIFDCLRALEVNPGSSPVECIRRLEIEPSPGELEAVERMRQMATTPSANGALRDNYRQAIEWYPSFYRLIERAMQRIFDLETGRVKKLQTIWRD